MISFASLSETGSRDHNEDSVSLWQSGDEGCFALADGLGGHGGGEVASQIAVDVAISLYKNGIQDVASFLPESFERAQQRILEKQQSLKSCVDMKTTLVVLCIGQEQIQWSHIGDSRLYYFENGKIHSRTLDHSVPQMLVSVGEIREKDIRHHPDRNRLLRVLGVSPEEEDELRYTISDPMPRHGRQAFLLCSDGFWELIEEKKMESLYRRTASPSEWLDAMQDVILKNGRGSDMDNYSAIAVWLENKGRRSLFRYLTGISGGNV